MTRMWRWGTAAAAGVLLLVLAAGPAHATPAYAKTEKKSCSDCHLGKTSDKVFTEAGKHYAAKHSLKGFGEDPGAPEPAADSASAPAAKPSGEVVPETIGAAATAPRAAGPAPPCDCECREPCAEKPCGHHGPMHGGRRMPPMREKMTGHLEEMRQAVSGLRESEKKLEASAGSDRFRAAVLDHLRKLDALQASHLEHMESMMGQMGHGKEAMRCGTDCPPGCKEKHDCDCPCGGMKR